MKLEATIEQIRQLVKREKYSEAIELADHYLVNNPKEAQMWSSKSYVNAQAGDILGAIDDVSQAIALAPDEPAYWYKRGQYWFEKEDYKQAIVDFSHTIEASHKHGTSYYVGPAYLFRADSYLRIGELQKARDDCQQIPNDLRTWTDRIRTKEAIVKECEKLKCKREAKHRKDVTH